MQVPCETLMSAKQAINDISITCQLAEIYRNSIWLTLHDRLAEPIYRVGQKVS